MNKSALLDHGAGLLAYALAEAGADGAEFKLVEDGNVAVVLLKAGEIVATGRVLRSSSLVRWSNAQDVSGEIGRVGPGRGAASA